jgi:hypothetical protein
MSHGVFGGSARKPGLLTLGGASLVNGDRLHSPIVVLKGKY